jgi:hypothetical protein
MAEKLTKTTGTYCMVARRRHATANRFAKPLLPTRRNEARTSIFFFSAWAERQHRGIFRDLARFLSCHNNKHTPHTYWRSRDHSVGIVTGYGLHGPVSIPSRVNILLIYTASTPALRPVLPHIQWVLRALFMGVGDNFT